MKGAAGRQPLPYAVLFDSISEIYVFSSTE